MSGFGIHRLIRDVLGMGGTVEWDGSGRVGRITLNEADRLAHRLVTAFQTLAGAAHVVVSLGET